MRNIESKSVLLMIKYALSEKYRKRRFKETGKRPKRQQELEVSAKDLPEGVREKVYDLLDLTGSQASSEVSKTLGLSVPSIKTWSRKVVGGKGGSHVRLSDYPRLKVPSSPSSTRNLMEFDEPLVPPALGRALSRREKIWEEKRAEHIENLNEAAQRLLSLLEEHSGTVTEGEGRLKPPLVIRGDVLSDFQESDCFDTLKEANEEAKSRKEAHDAEKKRRKKARKREKRKRREQRKAERREWVETYGSEVLQAALEKGYDCQRRYVLERIEAEYDETFRVDFDSEASYSGRSCPSEEALRFAQEVGGEVVWLTRPPKENPGKDGYSKIVRSFEEQEAVRKRIRIGEHGKRYALFRTFE